MDMTEKQIAFIDRSKLLLRIDRRPANSCQNKLKGHRKHISFVDPGLCHIGRPDFYKIQSKLL